MSSNWITDRPPTKADGDEDGEVVVRRGPVPARKGLKDSECHIIHWSHVACGAPWRHILYRRPPAAAPEPAPNPALAQGQVWRRRDGLVVTVNCYDSEDDYPFRACNLWYSPEGRPAGFPQGSSLELVELVTDVPPVPEAPKATRLEPRRFVSISRTVLATGQEIVDAIDDEGVAWELAGEEWHRLKPLPPREPSAAD